MFMRANLTLKKGRLPPLLEGENLMAAKLAKQSF